MSGDGEIGREATMLGRSAACRYVSAADSVVAMEHTVMVRAQQQFQSGSRMDAGAVTIGEESDRDFFYFKQREIGASVFDQGNISSNKKREKDIKEVKN
jgi:hypothetical protein